MFMLAENAEMAVA